MTSQVLHALPGRLRLHLPGWSRGAPAELEGAVCAVPGVRRASVSATTRNILVLYDPRLASVESVQAALRGVPAAQGGPTPGSTERAATLHERIGGERRRVRIAVPNLDSDPELAARVLRRLRRHPGVTATANPLTSRVLVEYDQDSVSLEDLLADASDPQATGLNGHSPHPLDRAPLIQGAARLAGAALGLTALILLQLLQARPHNRRALTIASLLSVLQGSPALRHALRRVIGPAPADAALALPSIAALTFAGNPVGLALALWDALRVVADYRAMRQAWQRYEQYALAAPPLDPGATVQLDSGQHTTCPARVLSGVGLAIGPEGLPFGAVRRSPPEPGSSPVPSPWSCSRPRASPSQIERPSPGPSPTINTCSGSGRSRWVSRHCSAW